MLGNLTETSADSWGKRAQLSMSAFLPNQVSSPGVTEEAVGSQGYRLTGSSHEAPSWQSPGPIYSNHLLFSASAPRLQMMPEESDTCASWHQDNLSWALHTTQQSFHMS